QEEEPGLAPGAALGQFGHRAHSGRSRILQHEASLECAAAAVRGAGAGAADPKKTPRTRTPCPKEDKITHNPLARAFCPRPGSRGSRGSRPQTRKGRLPGRGGAPSARSAAAQAAERGALTSPGSAFLAVSTR